MAKDDKRHRRIAETDSTVSQNRLVQQSEAPGSDVTDERLRNDDTNPNSWLQYNKGLRQLGYSPADRITPENVGSLSEEYSFEIGGFQFNPIVVPSGGEDPPVMYFPEGQSVRAINARTGDDFWTFDYSPEYGGGARNRGVSVRGDKVYFAGGDLRVVALNRYTGEQQWTTHAVSQRQREEMEPSTQRLSNTGAPLVFDGTVFKGQSGEGGNWGAVVAMDAESGDIVWDYDVIPPGQWVDETWRFGDGSPWTTPSIDPDSETLVVPTGNPSPQINAAVRPGPNKHSDSVLALDTNNGDVKWTHQLVANDWWDYDTYLTRIFDMEIDGETTRVVQAKDKTGWIYIIDIETGQLLRRSLPHANQGAELPFMGIPPAGKENAKEKSPTAIGGTDWHPDGYSPETGLVYIASIDDFRGSWYNPDWSFDPDSLDHEIGGGKEFIEDPESGEKASRASAIDPDTGEVVWATPYDNSEEPFWAGGNTPTGGNLVFAGNNGGMLRALDAESGEPVWENQTEQSFSASPVIWDDPGEGKQYVAIASQSMMNVFGLEAEGTATGTEGETETGPGTGTDAGTDSTTDTTTPGFGAAAGAAGVGGAAYLAKRRRDSQDERGEDAGDDTAGGRSPDDSEGDDA